MPTRAVALLSGGLDSMLAIRVLQNQGVEVEALNFQTIFTCCKDTAARAAHQLGVRLTVLGQHDDYVELIRTPRYGYGKGANPCVDCRIFMFRLARKFADDVAADVVVSGEVLGQRPMSQKRRDLMLISRESGLVGRLLRPLSARLLPATTAESRGHIDRDRLYAFSGRSRKPLIALARHFGFTDIPSPSTGCALTEKSFAGKVHDLVDLDPGSRRWDFELLNIGRHLRIDATSKAVVGRNQEENAQLEQMVRDPQSRATLLVIPDSFSGPTVLVVGPPADDALHIAGGLALRYSKHDLDHAEVLVEIDGRRQRRRISRLDRAESLATL